MKVLIISAETWRDDKNGGNVLSNIFENSGFEFAQIYCNPGSPSNKLCKTYYQMTDKMMINSILNRGKPGKVLTFEKFPKDTVIDRKHSAEEENRHFYDFFRKFRFEIFYVFRSLIWKLGNWKTTDLKNFITDFKPDLIFAPCYASHEMLAIDRYAKSLVNVPMISYISDDNYSFKQFRLSPIYWFNRIVLRKNMRKTFRLYDLVYTMTDEQKKEYEKALNCQMKILRKSGDFSAIAVKESVNAPIRLIYAGGIYCGRWKTLAKIVDAIKMLNKNGLKFILNIYTGNTLSKKQKMLLHDGVNSFVHKSISLEMLKQKYSESDIALHVESFELKYKFLTRLSFSTKIIDCLSSGCAVMAICWDQQSGYKYLKENDIAYCTSSESKILDLLKEVANNPEGIKEYAIKARKFGIEHHQNELVRKEFFDELKRFAGEI